MRDRIMDVEQKKKPGTLLKKQDAQAAAPIGQNAASSLQTRLMAAQASLGNRYVQRMVAQLKAKQNAREAMEHNQDGIRENHTGLPDSLKLGIEQLSGYSMDDVHVHYNSSKPEQVQALAYTQGREIYVAPGQEQHLPHEAWHVIQQKQGRVHPTLRMRGVQINDDDKLENEADLIAGSSKAILHDKNIKRQIGNRENNHAVKVGEGVSQPQAIQRRVIEFDAETETYDPPGTDILETIDMSYFTQSPKQIAMAVRQRLNDPLVKSLEVPTQVTATLEYDASDTHPKRGSRTQNIGLIGIDEFWIKRGLIENFEGGHLISHALWDMGDPDVSEAASYRNIVPMSRTMNVIDWADREYRIADKLVKIPNGDQLEVIIDIGHQLYGLSYQILAERFGLTLNPHVNPADRIKMYGWLPLGVRATWKHIETGSEDELSEVEENSLRKTHQKIKTRAELIDALKGTGIWNHMSSIIKSKVNSL